MQETFYLRNCIVHLVTPKERSKGIICDQQSWNEVVFFYVQYNSATQVTVESFCSYSFVHSYLYGNSVFTVIQYIIYTVLRTALDQFVLLSYLLILINEKIYLNG